MPGAFPTAGGGGGGGGVPIVPIIGRGGNPFRIGFAGRGGRGGPRRANRPLDGADM